MARRGFLKTAGAALVGAAATERAALATSGVSAESHVATLFGTLTPEQRQRVKGMLAGLARIRDAQQLRQMLGSMELGIAMATPEQRPAIEYIAKKLRERVDELESSP